MSKHKREYWGASLYYYSERTQGNIPVYLGVWAANRYRAQDEVYQQLARLPGHAQPNGERPRITLVSLHPIAPEDEQELAEQYLDHFSGLTRAYWTPATPAFASR